MRYRFIDKHKKVWPITLMCKLFQVSRSGYYSWRNDSESSRAISNRDLDEQIAVVFMRRHAWRLSNEQQVNLDQYLSDYPVLKALYEAKQRLNRYLLLKTLNRKTARHKLPGFLKLIEQLKASPLHALAKTLTSWLEPIVAMWRFRKSNGITEGFHTKMEMMTRRAYGFRNFENYRLRVLTHCGWDGIINRV
ncbi:MAG: transposase [bacterium]